MTSPRRADSAPDLKPLWTSKRICEFLSTTDRWLRRNVAADRFPPCDFRIGKSMRWEHSTIIKYLETRKTAKGVPKE